MTIKDGGQTASLKARVKEIIITHNTGARNFELWIKDEDNNESLSYATIEELLDLRDDINASLTQVL